MELSNFLSVILTRETRTVSQAGFGTILIAGPNLNMSSRTAVFSSLSSLASALVGGTSASEYLAAQAILSQSPRVVNFKIGNQIGTKTLTDDAGTYTAGSISVTVNGTEYVESYDTDKNTTLTALAASIAANAAVSTCVYTSGSHTIVITPTAGYNLSVEYDLSGITGSMTFALSATATEAIVDTLTAIRLYDDDWYGLITVDRTQVTVELVAAWIEANSKVFATASSDSDIIDVAAASDTTSLPAVLKAAGYDRTVCLYAADPTEFSDAAFFGKLFPYTPGSYTAKFKKLSGITRDLLSETQSTNARAKNCITFETVAGNNITTLGKVSSGENFDIITGSDWFVARIQEAAFIPFINQLKISFDDDGIQSIRNAVEEPCEAAVAAKFLKPLSFDDDNIQTGGYYFIVPRDQDISSTDKLNRELNDFEIIGFLAGAIEYVGISIKVSY